MGEIIRVDFEGRQRLPQVEPGKITQAEIDFGLAIRLHREGKANQKIQKLL